MSKNYFSSKQKDSLSGSQEAAFILKISSAEDYDLQGKIEHVGSGQFQTFHSVGDMVRLINHKIEEVGMPQSGSKLRNWS